MRMRISKHSLKDNPINSMYNKIQFFIVVHNINIINVFERDGKYNKLPNYTYLLVGNTKEDYSSNKIIQCNKLSNNIEHKNNFLAYTGWYALVNNAELLRDYEYTCLLEYDTDIEEYFDLDIILSTLNSKDAEVWGITGMDTHSGIFDRNHFTTGLFTYFKEKNINSISVNNKMWMTTNNMFFKTDFLKKYITDIFTTDFFNHIGNDKMAGHFLERFLSIYCYYRNIKFDILNNSGFIHRGYDSHSTQNIYSSSRGYEQFKIKNNIYDKENIDIIRN